MKKLLLPLLMCGLLSGCLTLEELSGPGSRFPYEGTAAIVRHDGLMVLLPEIGGPGTYGYYIVPNDLGRQSTNRFVHRGNVLQINFLGPRDFKPGFANLSQEEKLRAFFAAEADYQRRRSGLPAPVLNERSFRLGGVAYRSGTLRLPAPGGRMGPYQDVMVIARTAGEGVMHGGLTVLNPRTATQSRATLQRMLGSFRVVNRPLTEFELRRLTQDAMAGR